MDIGRERAAIAYRKAAAEAGLTPTELARRGGIPDVDTVRDFMDGERWPRTPTRAKLEKAIGWEPGTIEGISLGEPVTPTSGDPVVRAIEGSELNRANRHRLIGTYYELLDQQGSEGVRGA